MIDYYKRKPKDKEVTKIKGFEQGCWINVTNPTESDLNYLISEYNLDKDKIGEGIDEQELPGIYFDESVTYIYTKSVTKEKTLVTFLTILLDNAIITICKYDVPLVYEILNKKTKFITSLPKKAALELFALNNDYLEDVSMSVVKKVNSTKSADTALGEKEINSLLQYEESLNTLASAYTYMLRMYNKMMRRMDFIEDDLDDVEELIVESEQGLNVCVNSLKSISNIRNYHSLLLSNKLNRSITLLTIFTILISISTAFSGIYGMNIVLPFQQSQYAFFYILGIMLILMSVFLLILKKKEVF